MKKNLTYKTALEELEELVNDIEDGSVPIDQLFHKIHRANELVDFCKTKLRAVEEEVNRLLPKKAK